VDEEEPASRRRIITGHHRGEIPRPAAERVADGEPSFGERRIVAAERLQEMWNGAGGIAVFQPFPSERQVGIDSLGRNGAPPCADRRRRNLPADQSVDGLISG